MRSESDGSREIARDNVMPFVGRAVTRFCAPRGPAQIIQLYPRARRSKGWSAVASFALIIVAMLVYATALVFARGLGPVTAEIPLPAWLWW